MNLEIIDQPFSLDLYGLSGKHDNNDFGATGVKLMDAMWKIVKAKNLPNKGINYWVYEKDHMMFTGVELEQVPPVETGFELKKIRLKKYAYAKHIGSYDKLKDFNTAMRTELSKRGIEYRHPCVEIYGHWREDENKLETEVLWAVD